MLLLLSTFSLITKPIVTAANEKRLSEVRTKLPAPSLRHSFPASVQDVREFQLSAGYDEVNKRSVGALKRSPFKGIAVPRNQWASRLWPGGVVPYEISPYFTSQEQSMIQWAMDAFHIHTCIRFLPRTPNDVYYLSITKNFGAGCYSNVGRMTSDYFRTPEGKFKSLMNMHSSCFAPWVLLHELMHIIGFLHEHQRKDRDARLSALMRKQTWMDYKDRMTYSRTQAYYMGDYDPASVMHYVIPGFKPYPSLYFSQADVDNINKLYHCY